jgi:hypothetical protein
MKRRVVLARGSVREIAQPEIERHALAGDEDVLFEGLVEGDVDGGDVARRGPLRARGERERGQRERERTRGQQKRRGDFQPEPPCAMRGSSLIRGQAARFLDASSFRLPE